MKNFLLQGKERSEIPNIITSIRIVVSIALLFCQALSPIFYILYIIGGISDMLDGLVARKTDAISDFGSKLDTIADIIFAGVCLIKLLPVMNIPVWIYLWILVIAAIKMINIVFGYVKEKKLVSIHSIMNKVTGMLLFILPLTLSFVDIKYSATVVCVVATMAAVHEGYLVGIFDSAKS